MKKTKLFTLALMTIFLVFPFYTHAYSIKSSESVYIPSEEIIDGNLYVAGLSVTIDGRVTGDVIGVARTMNINGKVDGDILTISKSVTVNGDVDGSIRAIGEHIEINGNVARNINALGTSIILGDNSNVGWDVLAFGETGTFKGNILGNLHGSLKNVILGGNVEKNIDFKIGDGRENIKILETATLKGDFSYTSSKEKENINKALVAGEVIYNTPEDQGNTFLKSLWKKFLSIFNVLIIGLVLITLWKKHFLSINEKIEKHFKQSLWWGIINMFIVPIAALILAVTIIGFPLAIILVLLWLIFIYLGKIIFAIFIGHKIINYIKGKHHKENVIIEMIVGIIVLWALISIPIVGWAISLFAVWVGTGAAILIFKKK